MHNSSGEPWSHCPNAPQIPRLLHFGEKANFSGFLVGAIFYGMPNSFIRIRLVHSIHRSRDRYRSFLPLYERVAY